MAITVVEQDPAEDATALVRPSGGVAHKGAIVGFLAPFVGLFVCFYIVPILYAIYQSFFKTERQGAFGAPQQVFGGFSQYALAFQNSDFWASIGRVLMFFVISIPLQLGLALVFALLLDSPIVRGKSFFRVSFFAPYAVPGVIAALMWGFLYAPSLSPFTTLVTNVRFLSPELVLFAIANIVNWVFIGYNMIIIYSALQGHS